MQFTIVVLIKKCPELSLPRLRRSRLNRNDIFGHHIHSLGCPSGRLLCTTDERTNGWWVAGVASHLGVDSHVDGNTELATIQNSMNRHTSGSTMNEWVLPNGAPEDGEL